MGTCCASDYRNSENTKTLFSIFDSEPSVKIHKKVKVTWKDIGPFPLDNLLQENYIAINVHLKIIQRDEVVNNEQYYGQVDNKGKKKGIGRLCIPQQGMYEGEFNKDQIHGFGRYIYPTYEYYEGFWKNG